MILGDPLFGLTDEANRAGFDVGEPADGIEYPAIGVRIERVDGEVAPLGIDLPVTPEFDLGVTSGGFDVLAQRGDLEGTGLMPADFARATTSSGFSVVARSTSPTGSPIKALRIAPPTTRTSPPSVFSRSKTRFSDSS